jgi:hypothetical protein
MYSLGGLCIVCAVTARGGLLAGLRGGIFLARVDGLTGGVAG